MEMSSIIGKIRDIANENIENGYPYAKELILFLKILIAIYQVLYRSRTREK